MSFAQLTKSRTNPFLVLLDQSQGIFSRRRKEDSRRAMEEQTLLKILEMWGMGFSRFNKGAFPSSSNTKKLSLQGTPFDAISKG